MTSSLDDASPSQIRAAIKAVNQTPAQRSKLGLDILWHFYKVPKYTIAHSELVKDFGAPELHFGWFCRRVAERLGDADPAEYALTNRWAAADGALMLTLKSSVVNALSNSG